MGFPSPPAEGSTDMGYSPKGSSLRGGRSLSSSSAIGSNTENSARRRGLQPRRETISSAGTQHTQPLDTDPTPLTTTPRSHELEAEPHAGESLVEQTRARLQEQVVEPPGRGGARWSIKLSELEVEAVTPRLPSTPSHLDRHAPPNGTELGAIPQATPSPVPSSAAHSSTNVPFLMSSLRLRHRFSTCPFLPQ